MTLGFEAFFNVINLSRKTIFVIRKFKFFNIFLAFKFLSDLIVFAFFNA